MDIKYILSLEWRGEDKHCKPRPKSENFQTGSLMANTKNETYCAIAKVGPPLRTPIGPLRWHLGGGPQHVVVTTMPSCPLESGCRRPPRCYCPRHRHRHPPRCSWKATPLKNNTMRCGLFESSPEGQTYTHHHRSDVLKSASLPAAKTLRSGWWRAPALETPTNNQPGPARRWCVFIYVYLYIFKIHIP